MKRYALLGTVLGLLVLVEGAQANWGTLNYGGYQPWWNIFAKRNRCLTVEEERLQHFWHDYYDALRRYYDCLDNIDWVAYYKNHGYQINTGCNGPNGGCQRIMFAPVFVSPSIQWAVPQAPLGGPPMGPPPCPPAGMFLPPPGGFPPHGMLPPPGAFPPPGPPPGAFPPPGPPSAMPPATPTAMPAGPAFPN